MLSKRERPLCLVPIASHGQSFTCQSRVTQDHQAEDLERIALGTEAISLLTAGKTEAQMAKIGPCLLSQVCSE